MALVIASACGSAQVIPNPPAPVSVLPSTTELTTPATTTTEPPAPEPTTTTEAPTTVTAAPAPTEYLQPVATTPPPPASSSTLASIRSCESGSDYSANTGNGYYGAYQFSLSTWASVGGAGNPAYASPSEQDMRAQMLIDGGYRSAWPNC